MSAGHGCPVFSTPHGASKCESTTSTLSNRSGLCFRASSTIRRNQRPTRPATIARCRTATAATAGNARCIAGAAVRPHCLTRLGAWGGLIGRFASESDTHTTGDSMTHIGPHPSPEMYAPGLEIDCQCARCGSTCGSEQCGRCEEGIFFDFDDDGFDDLSPTYTCPECKGDYVSHYCLSSPDWCKSNPLPGRESVGRGQIEWFTIQEQGTA